MASTLTIAVLPLDIAWSDVNENLVSVERTLKTLHPATDLVVLPELFTTGFIQDKILLDHVAESISGNTITTIKRWASEYNIAIAGSYLCKTGDKIYNRAFIVEPSGDETFYDKRHLFSLSAEHDLFNQGQHRPPVVRFRGWNLSIVICYDLRFPVWCRNANQRYDVMLVPANWPNSRGYAWKQLNYARAIENQAIYVGANRSGIDDFGDYNNLSMIVDSLGKPFGTVDPASGIIYGRAEKSILDEQRRKLPFGQDADDFSVV